MDKVYDENKKNDEEKEINKTTDYKSTTFGEGIGLNNERGGENVDLFEEAERSSRPISEALNEKMIRLVNLMRPLVQVTGFMIFLINMKKSLPKV